MPRTGRPPKENPQDGGARRTLEWTDLGADPIRAAEAIGRRPGGGRWSTHVRRWWEAWARSPMASQFLETDWNHLRHTALLLEEYVAAPTSSKWAAIERSEERLGGTVAARMMLRLRTNARPRPAEEPKDAERPRSVSRDPRLELVRKAASDG